jgi:metallo-beta-lactamase family protein
MKLTFYGGAGSVTGANYMLESGNTRILIDCGLVQGSHFAEKQNFEPFAYDPRSVDALFVTHAHIDHTGRIPKLIQDGFQGRIISTPPTKDFAEHLLYDSAHILGKEAEREGIDSFCRPEWIDKSLAAWDVLPYHEKKEVGPFTASLWNAGHILGSAIVKVEAEGKTVLFSGDLGNTPAPIIQPTEFFEAADYALIESTYGDRIHGDPSHRREELEDVIEDTVKSGGTLLIPAFAMERTQDILFHLNQLVEAGRIPHIPVFIDSPLAIKLTHVYAKYTKYFDAETRDIVKSGDDIFNFKGLRLTLTTEQSKEINAITPPKIIIAGSGMSNGGRILHHEARYLPDPNSTILFVGYQAQGTLGRRIMDGEKEVTIMGMRIPVRAKVVSLTSYSAHADQPRLLSWIRPMRKTLKAVFVIQGEEESSRVLQSKISDELAVKAIVPDAGDVYEL